MSLRLIFFIAVLYGVTHPSLAQTGSCPIIPQPSEVAQTPGQLRLSVLQRINTNNGRLFSIAHFLQTKMLSDAGLTLSLSGTGGQGAVVLELTEGASGPDESYKLMVTPDQVVIRASTPHGIFNGVISLLQLARIAADGGGRTVACWKIADAPQMSWRGLMLDESRHFFGKQTVENILDWMAFYKLNRFHWHLTDVPGWRVEIKAYPNLTLVGGIGNHTDSLAAAKFYTQDEINAIVQYAADRFIQVIPEIDMPGHARAANRAYPEFSGGGSKDYPEFTFNPGKEGTYAYLTRVLREVDVLFPYKMIHIGGDEVAFGNEKWKTDPDVQRLMTRNKLRDLTAVEHYFTERMADSVTHLGAKVLGWDEIAATKIPADNMIIFWWRQNKPDALKEAIDNGYKVVLCPRIPFYFDFVQDSTHLVGRRWSGKFSDLKTIYQYSMDQYPDIIGKGNRDQVMGVQANIWTERIVSDARLEYMLFPRITALSEAAWTSPSQRDYSKFVHERLLKHQGLFKTAGLHYFDAGSPKLTPEIIR